MEQCIVNDRRNVDRLLVSREVADCTHNYLVVIAISAQGHLAMHNINRWYINMTIKMIHFIL